VTSYDATHLTSIAPIPQDVESFLPEECFAPPFPTDGSLLQQVRWQAGLLEFLLECLVEVVVDGEDIGIRFVRTEANGELSGSESSHQFGYPMVVAYMQGLLDMAFLVHRGAFDRD
jgi:hypothetical protein